MELEGKYNKLVNFILIIISNIEVAVAISV